MFQFSDLYKMQRKIKYIAGPLKECSDCVAQWKLKRIALHNKKYERYLLAK